MAKKTVTKTQKKDKKPTAREMLYSIDKANQMLDYAIESLNKKFNLETQVIADEIMLMREEISRLNETLYEDRRVLADFVTKFFKDTKTILNPKLAIDGSRKAKTK